uniref:DUF4168 domain-containing protein n=1 Tax=Cyanothece sp. (strain PCC 7425 / ATCC 29141) TaxID=395961 RepID=B8HRH3_CYAP4
MFNVLKTSALAGILILTMTPYVSAAELQPPSALVAQVGVTPGSLDGFDLGGLIIQNIQTAEMARKAMKSSDPEVRQMAEQIYNSSMSNLQSLMTMYMKKSPFRTTSPR